MCWNPHLKVHHCPILIPRNSHLYHNALRSPKTTKTKNYFILGPYYIPIAVWYWFVCLVEVCMLCATLSLGCYGQNGQTDVVPTRGIRGRYNHSKWSRGHIWRRRETGELSNPALFSFYLLKRNYKISKKIIKKVLDSVWARNCFPYITSYYLGWFQSSGKLFMCLFFPSAPHLLNQPVVWYLNFTSIFDTLCGFIYSRNMWGLLHQVHFFKVSEHRNVSLVKYFQKIMISKIACSVLLQDHRLILHHSLVAGIEKHHKSMFRRGGKIIVSLHPKPRGQQRGPFASSSFNYIRLVFRNGGEDEVNILCFLRIHGRLL